MLDAGVKQSNLGSLRRVIQLAHRVASGLSRYALPVAVGLSVLLTLLAWTNPSQFGPGSLHTVYMAEGGVWRWPCS